MINDWQIWGLPVVFDMNRIIKWDRADLSV